jgi:hypothetical protein
MQGTINIKVGNKHPLTLLQLKYLGIATANQNFMMEEIKRTMNSSNTCYHSAQGLFSHLLSRNVKIRIHKTLIL